MRVTLTSSSYTRDAEDYITTVYDNITCVLYQREGDDFYDGGVGDRTLVLAREHYSAILIEDDDTLAVDTTV